MVCPCCQAGDKIATSDIVGHGNVLLKNITTLTATSNHRANFSLCLFIVKYWQNGVGRAVKGKSRVVGHTAVNRNVGLVAGNTFNRTDGVKC